MEKNSTQQFIEDAIAGGWGEANDWRPCIASYFDFINFYGAPGVYKILLDPLAWQAVGKTRLWSEMTYTPILWEERWQSEWHSFIDHLADGKTIDEALQAIHHGV